MQVRTWWSQSVAAHRVKLTAALLLVDAFLVLFLVAGWQAVRHQLIRHGDATVRVTATVTDTVRHCGKGGCQWLSLGRDEVAGRVQTDVVVVNSSRRERRDPQIVLVDPAHPRRAVNLRDHGFVRIVLGALAVPGIVVANLIGIRSLRRPWPPAPAPRLRRHGGSRA